MKFPHCIQTLIAAGVIAAVIAAASLGAFIESEIARWAKVIKATGATAD